MRIRLAWMCALSMAIFLAYGSTAAKPLTLPSEVRPSWVSEDGIIMAGSWEPLFFRVRRDGADGYSPTEDQRLAYEREQSQEMVTALKKLGVNFVMMHCYKGAGLGTEHDSMQDAARFSQKCHGAGLKVGVYAGSGTLLWEPLFKEAPGAKDWVLLGEGGEPMTYENAPYRYYWNRHHPAAREYHEKVLTFAIKEIKADLIHFDNYVHAAGSDPESITRFQRYLRHSSVPTHGPAVAACDAKTVQAATAGPPDNALRRAWLDFHAESLAQSYRDATRYARQLRKDILMECNPGGPKDKIPPGIDHGRLLQGGEAFWDEGLTPGYREGKLLTRIRTYKIARRMNNMAFTYASTPLEMAESMAFNMDCLGCVCWFEYGKMVRRPGSVEPLPPEGIQFIRFFRERRDLFRRAMVIADVVVLRSYPSQVFGVQDCRERATRIEQMLIENPTCFQIIYDHHLKALEPCQTLVLAGCTALSDKRVTQIERHVARGGRLCLFGPAGTHDEWMTPRKAPAFQNLDETNVVRATDADNALDAIRRACGTEMTLLVDSIPGLCCEVTEQPQRRLVHLVNYRAGEPARNVSVRLKLPHGSHAKRVLLARPEEEADAELAFIADADTVAFTVPEVCIYGVAVVELGQPSSNRAVSAVGQG